MKILAILKQRELYKPETRIIYGIKVTAISEIEMLGRLIEYVNASKKKLYLRYIREGRMAQAKDELHALDCCIYKNVVGSSAWHIKKKTTIIIQPPLLDNIDCCVFWDENGVSVILGRILKFEALNALNDIPLREWNYVLNVALNDSVDECSLYFV